MVGCMTETTATIGAGKLLVFQPETGADAIALPVALGIQRFWARRLKEAGRPAAYFVAVGKLERIVDAEGADATADDFAVGDKFVLPLAGFGGNDEVARLIVAHGGRWGMQSSLSLMGPRFLLKARLVEAGADGLRILDERTVEDDNLELPRILVEIVASAALRTGVRFAWRHWSEPFTTVDEHAALHYLKAEGLCSMVAEGARIRIADAFDPVVAALAESPTMGRAVETARALFREMSLRSVPELALARQVHRLRELGVQLDVSLE